jgi:hypothetical protein
MLDCGVLGFDSGYKCFWGTCCCCFFIYDLCNDAVSSSYDVAVVGSMIIMNNELDRIQEEVVIA